MLRLGFLAVFSFGFVVACGGDGDPMMMIDDPRYENARLEIVGSPAVNLRYGDVVDLTVRYVEEDGRVIEEAPIEWAIVGADGGSRLGALQTQTGPDGQAIMGLTGGDTDAMFDVEVSPPADGAPVRFNVSVADELLGSVTVTMTYDGARELIAFDTYLFDAVECGSLDSSDLSSAIRSAPPESDITARPAFAGVDPGIDYAVAVAARNATHVSAFGCSDRITVSAGSNTDVEITLEDQELPPNFVGVWDLDNRFDFAGALPPSTEAVLDVISELADDDVTDAFGDPDFETDDDDGDGYFPEYGVDPGAFVTDIAMRQTCKWECTSGDWDSCSIVNHGLGDIGLIYEETFNTWSGAQSRFTGGCGAWEFVKTQTQNLINTQVDSSVPGFVIAWAQLASDLSNAITNAQIISELTITASAGNEFEVPISHELVSMVVPYSALDGSSEVATFALADAGFTSIPATETSTVDGNTLTIPEHSFDMNWGELTLFIYRNVLLPGVFGVDSTGELIATWVSCTNVASFLHTELENLFFFSPVSESDLEDYCIDGLNAVGTLLEEELAGRIDAPGTLTIAGTATGTDIDDLTGRVGTLSDGLWSGTFSEDTMTGDVSGTFTGVRAGE